MAERIAPLLILFACGGGAGFLARKARLPTITGALVAGFLLGPAFGVVDIASLAPLAALATVTLAFIAVLAGARLTPAIVRENARSALTSTAAQLVLCAPLLAVAFWFAGPVALAPLAALWGIVATTRSPIITVAMLSETKADGPLARHLLSVVVIQSAASLPLFFACLALASSTQIGALDIVRVGASLVFIALGFAIANAGARGRASVRAAERGAPVLLVAFFAMAGASVDVDTLRTWWPLALALSLLRAALTFIACRAAHIVARDADVVKRNAWIGLVPQAGVTAALASIVGVTIPVHGPAFATLAMAVVFVDEIVGAPLLRFALARAGETSARAATAPMRRSSR